MKIITISREFGSGGRELGKRLADILGFDYYDREIITAIADKKGLNPDYVERILENHAWQTVPLTYRHSFTGTAMIHVPHHHTELLSEQTQVLESIAKSGKDCIIVGRNADFILKNYEPLNLFVCADIDSRINRCLERADQSEQLTPKMVKHKIRTIDKNRARTRDIISGSKWGDRSNYNLIVNTTDWEIKNLAPAVAGFITGWFENTK
ncbi:MAG: cytidylate kinase-like family protein [Acutalibacteraceae bacterium]|nr:cytidylate kinase-like family protein [Acutalibacteraceae bacterium]